MTDVFKIFEVVYISPSWICGNFPKFYYVAKNETELISNSKRYLDFKERQDSFGGDISIRELNIFPDAHKFENLSDFELNIMLIKKD